MVFLEKNHDAVFQLNSLRLLRLKVMQRRNGNLLPWLVFLGPRTHRPANPAGQQPGNKHGANRLHRKALHCAPPFWPVGVLPAGAAGGAVSIHALVRLLETKTWLATRLISALVTLSTRSSCLKISRQ